MMTPSTDVPASAAPQPADETRHARTPVNDPTAGPMARLLSIMEALRDPDGGCPWDLEQDFKSIAPYTLEEAYEVCDAIERGDMDDLREELGDLLLQVVFHSQMAHEAGHFRFEDVAAGISDKMVRRHPHVFGDGEERDAASQTRAWEAQKAEERAEKGANDTSLLANIPLALPALVRAEKLTKRAARVGFDWPSADEVFHKLDEELGEVREAIASGDQDHVAEELGDLLFVISNLSRKLSVDPEAALRSANAKFERRFRWIEQRLAAEGKTCIDVDLDVMESHWLAAKLEERKS
ncbi:nucleoside triphosphate pyrophosphohydrolase [Hyphomonadaceae bacterium ML37]|nr:nucleoside triphosphate pyrophosphohydrolase [Hyphomonadaceae bacterium ML37]